MYVYVCTHVDHNTDTNVDHILTDADTATATATGTNANTNVNANDNDNANAHARNDVVIAIC